MTSVPLHPESPAPVASPRRERPALRIRLSEDRLWLLGLWIASVLFRLPALLNAGAVHSDAAIVGLQARHLLHGEWSWFLWGAGYQASFDAVVAALVFAVFGATPLALMVGPVIGHLILVGCVYGVLRQVLGARLAGLCALFVVLTPQPINAVSTLPPRQWCLTFVFLGIWLLERGALPSARVWLWRALGAFLSVCALYLDLYALQFYVGLSWLVLSGAFSGGRSARELARQLVPTIAGAALGVAVYLLSRLSPISTSAPAGMSFEHVPHNAALLWNECLPFILGYGVYVPGARLYPDLWVPPAWFHVVQWLGAASLGAGIVLGGLSLFVRRVPWGVRRLGVFGALTAAAAVGGFLVSAMPSDMWSARYLAPIVWSAPFALAPVAWALGFRRAVAPLAVALLVAMVGGWKSYGPWVDGPLPQLTERGAANEEREVAELLRARGIHEAAAQYWLSYRLGFLFGEDPVVVPLNPGEDRYRPYRERFERAPVVAYLFHPSEPRAQPGQLESQLRMIGAKYERLQIHGFTVLIHDRRGGR